MHKRTFASEIGRQRNCTRRRLKYIFSFSATNAPWLRIVIIKDSNAIIHSDPIHIDQLPNKDNIDFRVKYLAIAIIQSIESYLGGAIYHRYIHLLQIGFLWEKMVVLANWLHQTNMDQ